MARSILRLYLDRPIAYRVYLGPDQVHYQELELNLELDNKYAYSS